MKKKTATKKAAPTPKKKPTPRRATAKPTPRRATATPTPRRATAKPTPRRATAAKPTPRRATATPRKKALAPKKKKTSAARKTPAKKKTVAGATKKTALTAPPLSSRPPASQSALDVSRQLPQERPLTDEEREAMSKVAQTALVAVGATGEPSKIVASIASYVDAIRQGQRQVPTNQDVRLGLGVLWGEQVRAQVGWRWVHLSYPNGFASYALVPDDRAFACFPLNRVSELLTRGADGGTNTSVPLFESIRTSQLPSRLGNAYLVIG